MIAMMILMLTVYLAYKTGQAAGYNDAHSDIEKKRQSEVKAKPASNCADPVSYCDNCSCGKKARVIASLDIKRK